MAIEFLRKLKEALLSTLPVILIVVTIYFVDKFAHIVNFSSVELVTFLISSVLIIIGMWLFNFGSEKSMSKIGDYLGSSITKKQNMAILVIVFFLVGVFVRNHPKR